MKDNFANSVSDSTNSKITHEGFASSLEAEKEESLFEDLINEKIVIADVQIRS